MVFRRDSKVDAFQRQISALRHQLGGESDDVPAPDREVSALRPLERSFGADLPDLGFARTEPAYAAAYDRLESTALAVPAPASPAVPAVDTFTSVIAHTTTWNGNLESSGSLHIHGRVEGSLNARDDIFIAEEAEVEAVVNAANVTVAGSVRGSVQCTERFEILPRGKVAGDIRAPIVVVHEGALIAGDVSMAPSSELRGSGATSISARAAHGGD